MDNFSKFEKGIKALLGYQNYGRLITLYNTKSNERLYGKSVSSLAKDYDLDVSNISKVKNNKKKSYKGYDQVLEAKILYSGLDTLVFTYNQSKGLEDEFKGFDFLELYKSEARKTGEAPVNIGNLDFIIRSKAMGFYLYQLVYESMFLICIGEDKLYIKVLAKAFYLYELSEIRDSLNAITQSLFRKHIDEFNVSEFHYAIDVKFPFKVLEFLKQGDYKKIFNTLNKWGKYRSDGQVYYDNYTISNGAVQLQVYEKAIESFYNKDKDKREIFFQLFGFESVFDYEEYLKTDSQIVRFEYRLKNRTGYLKNYPMLYPSNCFDLQILRGILWVVWNKHTSMTTAENKILEIIFSSMKEVEYEKVDIESCYEKQLENLVTSVKGYITNYHIKKEWVTGNEYTLEEIMEELTKDLSKNFYYEALEKKRLKLKS